MLGSPLGNKVVHNEFGLGEEIDGYASKGRFTASFVGDSNFVDASKRNYTLKPGSSVIDKGAFLTTVTSANGQGRVFNVNDAGWFFDGNGIAGEEGDWIMIQGQPAPIKVVKVDRKTKSITVASDTGWSQGAGVSMP